MFFSSPLIFSPFFRTFEVGDGLCPWVAGGGWHPSCHDGEVSPYDAAKVIHDISISSLCQHLSHDNSLYFDSIGWLVLTVNNSY
jgi:hypothetical protein